MSKHLPLNPAEQSLPPASRDEALDAICQSIVITGADRLITYVNRAFEETTGYAGEEVLGRDCRFLQGPDSSAETVQEIHDALHAGGSFQGEILNYRKDGSTFWNELSINPIHDSGGRLLHFIAVQRDVTERRTTAARIKQQEEDYRLLFEQSPIGKAVVALSFRFARVNRTFCRMLGYTENELLGLDFPTITHPNDQEVDKASATRMAKGEISSYSMEKRYLRKDGSAFWAHLTVGMLFEPDGSPRAYLASVVEIDERKRAAEKLRQSDSLLRIAGGIARIGGWAIELPEGRIRWSIEAREIYEVPGDTEISVEEGFAFYTSDSREKARAAFTACSRDGTPFDLELQMVTARKRPIWVRALGLPEWEGAKIVRILGAVQDITEQKRTEAETARLANRLSTTLEVITDAFLLLDERWHVVYVNREGERLLQCPREQLLGRDVWEELGEPLDGAFCGYCRRAVERGQPIAFEEFSSSIKRWLAVRVYPSAEGLAVYFRDVSERRAELEREQLAAHRLQLATKAGGVGIWEYDHITGEITWDDQMFALYGTSPQSAETGYARWTNRLHAEDRQRVEHELQGVLSGSGGETWDSEFRIIRADNQETRFIHAQAALLRDSAGNPWRMIGTNWDVTQERERQEALTAALERQKELTAAALAGEQAKSQFLAVMSHEIRTPMNGILGFAELVSGDSNLSSENRGYLQTITSSGEALLRILDDILDFSRLDAGRMTIEERPFAPEKLVRDVESLFRRNCEAKGLQFQIELTAKLPRLVAGDAGRIRQILVNLVGNALKFTAKGSIGLAVRTFPLKDESPGIEFEVRDSGEGIPRSQIDAIFEPFTQADSTISRRHGGTGLGLSISRRLAVLMGGILDVESAPGEGTAFFLRLPMISCGAPGAEPATESHTAVDEGFARRNPLKILIVEDDRVNQKLLVTVIKKLGYEPLTAADGAEAVAMVERERVDFVLMDLQMPVMDGLAATIEIRAREAAHPPRPAVYICALTADILPEDRERCLRSGMDDYLNKPVKIREIADALERATRALATPASPR